MKKISMKKIDKYILNLLSGFFFLFSIYFYIIGYKIAIYLMFFTIASSFFYFNRKIEFDSELIYIFGFRKVEIVISDIKYIKIRKNMKLKFKMNSGKIFFIANDFKMNEIFELLSVVESNNNNCIIEDDSGCYINKTP